MGIQTNSIITNLQAANTARHYGIVTDQRAKSTEKLSSGYRINRAADDAAGLAISEKMRRQIRGLAQSADNIMEGVGFVQVADGALNEIHDMLGRISEISVKAANETLTDVDRGYLDSEVQQIKTECDRIFQETSFNERLIWKANEVMQIGVQQEPAVSQSGGGTGFDITLANYDKIPANGFTVSADAGTGVTISWTDYNNNVHTTEAVSFDTLKANNYSFQLADHFGPKTGANADLYDTAGNPVFNHTISFMPNTEATDEEIANAIDGVNISTGASVSMTPSWEGADTSGKLNFSGCWLDYPAAYASRHNDSSGYGFDSADDTFLEPSLTANGGQSNLTTKPSAATVDAAKTDNTGWAFSFNMKGIGPVTGTCTSISYYSDDGDPEDEGRWWQWNYDYSNPSNKWKSQIGRSESGTMAGLMNTLTGNNGLLSKNPTSGESGMNDGTGNVTMYFELTSQNDFSYAGNTSNRVGGFYLSFTVGQTDTQQSVLDRINTALNNTTILDFYKESASSDYASFSSLYPNANTIDTPVYGGVCHIPIQAGPEKDTVIDIDYEELSLFRLGIASTNVRTVQGANKAIDDVKKAGEIVSEQRAQFGAYQNRLEHAYATNKNTEENTQAAESKIRDTDMATEMVTKSKQDILAQVGESMITQANQNKQGLLNVIGGGSSQ